MGRRLHSDDEIIFAGFHFGGEYIFSNYHAAYAWGLFVMTYLLTKVTRGGGLMATLLHGLFPRRVRVASVRVRHKVLSVRAQLFGAWRPRGDDAPQAAMPRLNVCLLVTGTHGDVAPFIAFGLELVERHGHRVRLATHACYRSKVVDAGLEFYPLAGDPRILSQWMVQSQGRLLPRAKLDDLKEIPVKKAMINAIMTSCLDACTRVDLEDDRAIHAPRFVAHAIVANPVAYGHFHVAEALKVPLLMAFPQPWTPTASFPHPLASLPNNEPTTLQQKQVNALSFRAVETLQWQGLDANEWRQKQLGLRRLDVADRGASLLDDFDVPFVYTWSPALCPKPREWGDNCDIVGALTLKAKDDGGATYEPAKSVAAFLAAGGEPVFVGFGSMVIADPGALYDLILDAAEASKTRVIVQSSWSKIEGDRQSPLVATIGPCPHSWLMPHCRAVVHHGGAGTVAAGLRRGLPTLVCPFFGDQHFWGECCRRAGVGPPPIPIQTLTAEALAAAFETLTAPATVAVAEGVGAAMREEDGVAALADIFDRRLPAADMTCQVSLFCASEPTVVVAETWRPGLRLAVSAEAHAALERDAFAVPYCYVLWDTSRAVLGLLAGRGAKLYECLLKLLASFASLLCLGQNRVFAAYGEAKGGRPSRAGLAAYLLLASALAAVEAPFRFCIDLLDVVVGEFMFGYVLYSILYVIFFPFAFLPFDFIRRSFVHAKAHPSGTFDKHLHRPDAGPVDAAREQDLRAAAAVAAVFFDAATTAAGGRDRPRSLDRAAAVDAVTLLLAKPPPGQHERQRQRSSVERGLAVIARSPSSLLRRPSTAAKYGKSAAALLDSWFPDAPARVAVVDLALKYARHLRDAPLAGADRNTSLEMTANPV